MSVDDIKAGAELARDAITTAITELQGAIAQAQSLAQDAGARGWEGVAHTVMASHQALEAAAANLTSGHEATDSAVNAAGAITTQLAPTDVASRAAGVIQHYDEATNAIETAGSSVDGAYQYAQQAEADVLCSVISGASDDITTARQAVEAAKTTAATEQAEAANWGK
ncbi:MAG: hypothetical protein ACRDT4_22840 [Micromonosporaceae bacterium]